MRASTVRRHNHLLETENPNRKLLTCDPDALLLLTSPISASCRWVLTHSRIRLNSFQVFNFVSQNIICSAPSSIACLLFYFSIYIIGCWNCVDCLTTSCPFYIYAWDGLSNLVLFLVGLNAGLLTIVKQVEIVCVHFQSLKKKIYKKRISVLLFQTTKPG